MTPAGFPHSDTPGSTLGCQLPRAYRRLLRPSSALDAKASTMCPSQLVTHTTNPTHHQQTSHHKKTPPTPGPDRRSTHLQKTDSHKEPTHPPQSRRACHNKQDKPDNQTQHTHQNTGYQRCSRPLSRSQTTTPHRHHPRPPRTATSRVPRWPELEPQRAGRSPRPPHPDPDTPTHTYMRVPARGGPSDSSEPQQCAPQPRPRRAGSCRPPTTGTTITQSRASPVTSEPTTAVVWMFHIFQRHHQRQDTHGPGRGVCSLERR